MLRTHIGHDGDKEQVLEIKVPKRQLDVDSCIDHLESMKRRCESCFKHNPYFSPEYCQKLVETDSMVIDKVIELLRNGRRGNDGGETDV